MLLTRESGRIHYRLAVLLGFAFVLVLIAGSGVLAYRNAQAQDETAAIVIRTHRVLAALNQIETTMTDAETGQRGYLLTGEAHFLEPWMAATGGGRVAVIQRPPIGTLLASLRSQIPAGTTEADLLARIERLVADKLAELQQTIAMRRAGRLDEALAIVREGRGKRAMDALRITLSDMRAEQRRQLERSEVRRNLAARRAYVSGIAGCMTAVLAIALLMLAVRRAERSLLRREREFHTLADNISQHAWTLNAAGRFLWFNRRWQDYTGLHEPDLDAQWLAATDHPVHRDRVQQGLRHAVATGTGWEDILPLRAKDGTWHWFLVQAQPIRGHGGRSRRWFGSNTDIDDRLRLEQELKDSSRRKDEFIATLAHELRNPLAPIQAGLELMRINPAFPAPLVRTREIMHRQLAHLVRLIDDLLDVSRISTGRLELQRSQTEVRAIVESALETARPQIEAAGHTLDVALPQQALLVDGDPVRLAQVLANLLGNGAKYTPRGGRVAVTAAREDGAEGDGWACIAVSDNGIGIDAAMLPHIFDLFSQAPDARAMRQGGIGIGLAIARRLVEMHGGTLTVHSEGLGQGSTFTVRLPLARKPARRKDDVAPASAGSAAPGPPADAVPPSAARRILLLDDNEDAAQTLAALLGLAGHAVTLAHTGRQALDLAEKATCDLAILDIGLPDMTGYAVARALRTLPGWERVRLVALTGWGATADRAQSRDAGFDLHLTKPVTLQALAAALPELALPQRTSAT
jgi:PAS domain S-box-containing protein